VRINCNVNVQLARGAGFQTLRRLFVSETVKRKLSNGADTFSVGHSTASYPLRQ
jgi:hypothetical protein